MIRQRGWIFVAALLWVVFDAPIRTVWADDLQVNSYTTDDQFAPSVSLDADGDFVVVWDSLGSAGTDDSFESIQGRSYASGGAPAGGELQINAYTSGGQTTPSVSLDADGDFVVVWRSDGSPGTDDSYSSIQGRRYASGGTPTGGQFQVNAYTTDFQRRARVSLDADGDFVVVWQSGGSPGTDSSFTSVQGQRYASDGSALGGQFQVNTYTTVSQGYPSVSLDADGDFVVVWDSWGSYGTDSYFFSIQGQRYASDGARLGGEFQVNTYTTMNQLRPSVSREANGDFVVVWESQGSSGTDSSSTSIQGQRYASDGSAVGGEFQVNTATHNVQFRATVSLDADGDFAVVWNTLDLPLPPGSPAGDSLQGQRYASNGTAVGVELELNTYTSDDQNYPVVALDADGGFIIVWQSLGSGGTDTDGGSIQMSPAGLVFADGFESGDTAAWAQAKSLCSPSPWALQEHGLAGGPCRQ